MERGDLPFSIKFHGFFPTGKSLPQLSTAGRKHHFAHGAKHHCARRRILTFARSAGKNITHNSVHTQYTTPYKNPESVP